MTANSLKTEVLDKLYEKGAATRAPIERPDGGLEIVLPEGYQTHTIPALEPKLPRIRQAVSFYDLESFTAYVNAFKTEASRIFATPGHLSRETRASFTAIIDYHKVDAADYGAHVVRYLPKYSRPWEIWATARTMLQADFAEFIEENRVDIRKPDAAPLLDMVSKFKVTKKVDYDSVMHQPNGDVLVLWSDKTEVEGSRAGVTVPTELKLGIPVFFKGESYEVTILLRYKLNNGKVSFNLKPDRHEYVEQHAFDEMAKAIAEETGIAPYLGVAS